MIARIADSILALFGWRFDGAVPDVDKLVVIGAPHTSNWDFVLMVFITAKLGIRPSWLGKHTLFESVLGGMFRALGGIPVDRRAPNNKVDQIIKEIESRDRIFLIIAPEGTRRRMEYWKSGFYHMARGAGVPIALGYVNYPGKRVGIGPLFHPTDDMQADIARLADFYADKVGKYPEKASPVRFKQ